MDSYFEKRPDGRVVCRFEPGEEKLAQEFIARGPQQRPFELPPRGEWAKVTIGTSVAILLLSPLFGHAVGDDFSESLQTGLVFATGSAILMALFGILIRRQFVVRPTKQRLERGAAFAFEELAVPRRTVLPVPVPDRTEPVLSEHVVLTTDDVAVSIGHNAVVRADEVAMRLNEVLFEFEERRAVSSWLMQRERELADPGPYRRTT